MKERRSYSIYLSLIAAFLTFAAYIPALGNSFINWDDGAYVYSNLQIRTLGAGLIKSAFTGPMVYNWHPLTMLSLAVDYAVWGLDPFGYPLTNVIFHALNTFLAGMLAAAVIGWDRRGAVAAFVTAALFGLHPIHVESVAWIAERKDVLSAFFSILAILAYLGYLKKGSGRPFYYSLAFLFFALAILAKPMAVTIPAVLVIIDFYYRRPLTGLISIMEKLPFFALSAFSSVVTVWIQGVALTTLEGHPLSARFWVSVKGYAFYLYKMLMPTGLAPYYPRKLPSDVLSLEYLGALIVLIAITALVLFMARSRRGPLAVWLTYLVTLLPVIGLVQVGGQGAADRYSYMPSIVIFLFTGAVISSVFERGGAKRVVTALLFLLVAAMLSFLTIKQIGIWKDSVTIWSYEIERYPAEAPLAYINRGYAYDDNKEYAKAIGDYTSAIRLRPDYPDTYIDRGLAYSSIGDQRKAVEDFTTAISLSPGYAEAYLNRGISLRALGEPKGAHEDFLKAISLKPSLGAAYYQLGAFYGDMGDYERARALLRKADELGYR